MASAQRKIVSLAEVCLNVASGWFLSLLVWQFVLAPYFGYEITLRDNLQLTTAFTVISVVRGYIWRRFFARNLHVALSNWLGRVWRGKS